MQLGVISNMYTNPNLGRTCQIWYRVFPLLLVLKGNKFVLDVAVSVPVDPVSNRSIVLPLISVPSLLWMLYPDVVQLHLSLVHKYHVSLLLAIP
jgi:hypothetical protein